MKKRMISLTVLAVMCMTLLAGCGSKGVTLDETAIKYTEAGKTVQLHAEGKGELTYVSADENVATVDAAGLVTSVAPGSTVITITDEKGNTAECAVTCEWSIDVELAAFYDEVYAALYPADAEGNPTGPFVDNIAAMPEMLDGWYPGLSAISTEQCLVYMPMMTGVPYELALIEVTNADDVDAVKTILQTRIDTEKSNQFAYPMVTENWELNSRIVSNGNYIMMAVTADCETYVEAFNDLF